VENCIGVYKVTYLTYRIFTYYGSSKNVGKRVKYYYYNGSNQKKFFGLFLKVFGWSSFSVTLIEECDISKFKEREDWYLNTLKALLNYLTLSYIRINETRIVSPITSFPPRCDGGKN